MCDFDGGYDAGSDVGGGFDSDIGGDNAPDVSLDTEIEKLDELDDGNYHATHLSEEEIQQIDDLWKEERTADVEPYHATPNDLDIISDTDADRFAAEIEALSLDELEVEQECLDNIHNNADMDVVGEYDTAIKGSLTEEQYHDLVDELPKETLEYLRSGLENREQDVLDYFGLGSADEDSDNTEELVLKRSR